MSQTAPGWRSVEPPVVADRLSAEAIEAALCTRWLGRHLHCFDEVGSTNSVARDLARGGAPEGTVVLAEGQSQGRGRLGRSWVSPPGKNLYLSAVLRPRAPSEHLSQISLLAGVAVCETIGEWHPAVIKWPNDVLIGGRKVAGILIETEGEGASRFVVLGVGVNLNAGMDDFPPELRETAGSLRLATGAPIDRRQFVARMLDRAEAIYDRWQREGFAPIAAAWHERACLVGRPIVVEAPEGRVTGTVLGLDADGALRLQLPSGSEQRVVAGDVTVVKGGR